MNKVTLSMYISIIFILVACGPLAKSEKEKELNGEPLESKQVESQNEKTVQSKQPYENIELKTEISPGKNESSDLKALDDKVREMARALGENENTYRMFIKENPDGGKIYRQIGMFVTVFPNGEEYFLQDGF